jgi:predicted RNase H-like HicB family nuclease
MHRYHLIVEWDDEARVWVASSDDIPGLATGAASLGALMQKLGVVIPELLIENGVLIAHS